MRPSFFRLSPATESPSTLPADLPPTQLTGEGDESAEHHAPAEIVTAINATEETAQLLDQKAASLDVLAQIADEIPVADAGHLTLTELAAVEIVRGTDIDPETQVVPAMESAIGGRVPTQHIRGTADNLRRASRAIRLGLESHQVEQPLFDTGMTPSMEGMGSTIAHAMRKLFSTWKDSPENRNVWAYGSKEIIKQLEDTYANAEWVKMRTVSEEEIKLPKQPWVEYLVFPGDKLSTDDSALLVPMVRQILDFVAETCEVFKSYRKDLDPIYKRMVSQDPSVAVEYVKSALAELKRPAERMTIVDLPLPANRHIKRLDTGGFIDDWSETETPATVPAFGSVEKVVEFGKALVECARIVGNTETWYPNFYGHDNFSWWNSAYKQLPEADFNYLWRNFSSNSVHAMNGLETAGIKAFYSAVVAMQAIEFMLDKNVK